MKIKISKIEKICQQALIKHGFSKKDAQVITNEYLSGTLRGRKDHGITSLPKTIKKVEAGQINPKPKPKIIKKGLSFLLIDGDAGMASVIANKYIEEFVSQIKKKGIYLVAFKNMHTWIRPGYVSELLVKQNIISLVFNTGGTKAVVPTGGVEGICGTNPIAFGIPGGKQNLIADFATSTKAFGVVRDALREGNQLPGGYAIDLKGKECLDPQKTMNDEAFLLPFGNHKGYAINLLIEILTQAFVGELISGYHEEHTRRGYIIILINPACFVPLKQFKKQTQFLFKKIKSSKKIPAVKEIFIPGEKGERLRENALGKGEIEVDEKLIKQIKKLI